MRVTIIKSGVFDEFGQPLPSGSTATVSTVFGQSLVQTLRATDTDSYLGSVQNSSYATGAYELPRMDSVGLAALNVQMLAGSVRYPPGASVLNTTDGRRYRLPAGTLQFVVEEVDGIPVFPTTASFATKGKLSNNGGGTGPSATPGPNTFQVQTVLECDFDAIQILIGNADTVPITGVKCCILASAALQADNSSAANNASAAWIDATQGGATTLTLPANGGSAALLGWGATDIMQVPSVTRTDPGKTLPIISVRFFVASGQNITSFPGPGATGAAGGWESDGTPVASRPWRVRLQGVDAASNATKAALTATTSQTTFWPPILIRYWPRGSAVPKTMLVIYDSFGSAPPPGCAVNHFGWPERLQDRYSSAGSPLEIVNAALAGAGSAGILNQATGLAPVMKNAVAIYPNGTGNDAGNSLSAAFEQSSRWFKAKMRYVFDSSGMASIVGTMSPVDPVKAGARAYGATDAFRVDMNIVDVASGRAVADISTACSGVADGSGQIILQNTTDGFHSNDIGQASLVQPIARALKLA
jgi:lysophospholipase L1-like esterase